MRREPSVPATGYATVLDEGLIKLGDPVELIAGCVAQSLPL